MQHPTADRCYLYSTTWILVLTKTRVLVLHYTCEHVVQRTTFPDGISARLIRRCDATVFPAVLDVSLTQHHRIDTVLILVMTINTGSPIKRFGRG